MQGRTSIGITSPDERNSVCNESSGLVSRRVVTGVTLLVLALMMPGCSLGVMAGKMFFGDPKLKSQFRGATGVDLTKGEKSLLIICSAPHSILARHSAIQIDIVDRMSRHLDTRKVKVIPADDVASWFDDHGEWGDFSELAAEFKADFVMHIEIQSFSCQVPDSPDLLQGNTEGKVTVFRTGSQSVKKSSVAFERTFDVKYPAYPIPRGNKSEQLFTEGFLDRTAIMLAQFLYDHRASETVY